MNIFRVLSVLGIVTGILSISSLVHMGLAINLAAPLYAVMAYYHSFLNVFLGWADAPLEQFISMIKHFVKIEINLDQNWKHIFVLMWLYFSSDAKTNWHLRRNFSIFSILLGGIVAFISSIAYGTPSDNSIQGALAKAAIPIGGIFIWELVRDFWSAKYTISTPSYDARGKSRKQFLQYLVTVYALPVLAMGVVTLGATWYLAIEGIFTKTETISLFALGIYVILMGIYWLGRGCWLGFFDRRENETWSERRARSGSTHLGGIILTVIIGSVVFFTLNAGLSAVGL